MSMAVRSIIITKDMHHLFNFYALRFHRYQHHRMPLVFSCIRIGNGHKYNYFTSWISSTRCPPFLTINYVFISIQDCGCLHICSIRRCNPRLCHSESRSYLTIKKGLKPFFLMIFIPISSYNFHVSCIWSLTIHCF